MSRTFRAASLAVSAALAALPINAALVGDARAAPAPWGWWSTQRPPETPGGYQGPPPSGSTEFQRNYGLTAIHADAPYALGATGKGITVAVIDTGFNTTAPDMTGAYSPDSIDIVATRNRPGGVDSHGAHVAAVLGARFNGFGAVGAAYEATVLGIRGDATATGASCINSCIFMTEDLARSIDYAIAKGARIVNMSLADVRSGPDGPTAFEAALSRGVAAGLVFTVAAGNAGASSPATHALYASDSRYAGAFLAIGASNSAGDLASFSNRAGPTQQFFLVAPGEAIANDCNAANVCEISSGTSFAGPQVAGALAMLLQYFPNLSARDAVQILLRTADDKGDLGTDAVWGRGLMNLAKAFTPLGKRRLQTADGSRLYLPAAEAGSAIGTAFGAAAAGGDLRTVIHDDYNRPFAVDLALGFKRRPLLTSPVALMPPLDEATEAVGLPGDARLSLTAQAALFPLPDDESVSTRLLLRPEEASAVAASVRLGAFAFTVWRGTGPTVAPQGVGGGNAFHSLAAPDRAVVGAWRAGAFTLSGEGGWAERRTPLSLMPVEASRYATVSAAFTGSTYQLALSGGALAEPRGALGSELNPASPLSLAAHTRFAAAALDQSVGSLRLRAEASIGRTSGGGRLVDLDAAVSSSWRLTLSGVCEPTAPCARFGIELAQPLRVERGAFRALLADVSVDFDAPITFSERRFSAAPTSRELDLRLNTESALAAGTLRLEAGAAFNPGHVDGETALGVSAGWRRRF